MRIGTLIITAALAGCAAHPDPIVDMQGVNEGQLARDWEECEAYSCLLYTSPSPRDS